MTVGDESAAATYNNPELAQRLIKVFKNWFGEELTVRTKPIMGAEDFGRFGKHLKVPSLLLRLGATPEALQRAAQVPR